MYGCESWTVKKAECQRIDAFELWFWRRFLRVPWTARSSNQSILKEISPGCSLEGLMLKLKLQSFSHLMQRTDSFKNTLMLTKIEGRRRGWQRLGWVGWHHQLDGHEFEYTPGVGKTGRPGILLFMGSQRVRHDRVIEVNWWLRSIPLCVCVCVWIDNKVRYPFTCLWTRRLFPCLG